MKTCVVYSFSENLVFCDLAEKVLQPINGSILGKIKPWNTLGLKDTHFHREIYKTRILHKDSIIC